MHLTLHEVRKRFSLALKIAISIELLQTSGIFRLNFLLDRLFLSRINLLSHHLLEVALGILRFWQFFRLLLIVVVLIILLIVALVNIHQLLRKCTQLERILLLNIDLAGPLGTFVGIRRFN